MIGGSEYKKDSVAKSNDDSNEKLDKEAAKMEAARAIIKAKNANDPKMLSEALDAHYQACQIMEPDSEE
jgi:hypothetical protein